MSTRINIPGYVAGTWVIGPVHSEASFQVRQFGVAKGRGRFEDFEGTIVTAENPLDSSVNAVIKTASVNTKNRRRDKHLRQDDFLNVEQYPTITFTSTGVRADGDNYLVDGDLTIRAVTKQVTLNLELNGFGVGPDGKPQAGFSAHTEISRNEFGVTGGPAGAVISDKVKITLKIEAHRQD
jgi:polyisoprenoid-binding protein YceI